MLTTNIGSDPVTEVAYPAAGSFVGCLIRKYSLAKVKAVYQRRTESQIWVSVFRSEISELEKDWLSSFPIQ